MAKEIPYSKQELIEVLVDRSKELGRCPTKKDMPEDIKPYFKMAFKKWCYALEAAGLRNPSKKTLERRNRHKHVKA